MREACEGRASAGCEAPRTRSQLYNQGVGGWGVAPLARSTPTLWA
ncbi:MAG: hypothetical protein NZ455_01435 [Bacteroidia bacterium]|nr:hypothetical protein [Bacteroidia bacterium]MDW8347787.1 hypothetical protein [Bacteroidia bacterium]